MWADATIPKMTSYLKIIWTKQHCTLQVSEVKLWILEVMQTYRPLPIRSHNILWTKVPHTITDYWPRCRNTSWKWHASRENYTDWVWSPFHKTSILLCVKNIPSPSWRQSRTLNELQWGNEPSIVQNSKCLMCVLANSICIMFDCSFVSKLHFKPFQEDADFCDNVYIWQLYN